MTPVDLVSELRQSVPAVQGRAAHSARCGVSFLDVIPFTLFRMLASSAHARNVAVLERIFEQFFDDFAFAPKKAEVLQVIQQVLDRPDYRSLTEEDGPALADTADHLSTTDCEKTAGSWRW